MELEGSGTDILTCWSLSVVPPDKLLGIILETLGPGGNSHIWLSIVSHSLQGPIGKSLTVNPFFILFIKCLETVRSQSTSGSHIQETQAGDGTGSLKHDLGIEPKFDIMESKLVFYLF